MSITPVLDKKTHIIIPITDKSNLDQYGLIDKTPFYFQPTNTSIDSEFILLNPELQTYKLCVKRNFYSKCANKSYNIFKLIDSYFVETVIISSSTDISFNYSMTSKIPIAKYKLVLQALINWFSVANWWHLFFPIDKVGMITLKAEEIQALREYPNLIKNGRQAYIIKGLYDRIDNLIHYICASVDGFDTDKLWIKISDPQVSIRPGSVLKSNNNSDTLKVSGKDVIYYLIQHTGLKKICSYEYQGYIDILLINLPPPDPELCISAFIRSNKLIAISQSDLNIGYSSRLTKIINSHANLLINMINSKWQKLISIDGGKLEYEDIVLTIELIISNVNNHETKSAPISVETYELCDIKIWNIEMGYGAWTLTSSKLFTWAELELLSGIPPVIKVLSKPLSESK